MEKLNVTQLSKAFQVSKVTIRNWIDRGCPHEKTDKGNSFILSEVIKWHQERFLKTSKDGDSSKLTESRAMREHFKALLCELEYKERSGELIYSKDVKEAAFESGRLVRDQLLNIPARVSPIIAAERDAKKVNEILTQEIRQCLETIAADLIEEGKSQCQN